MSHNNFSYSNKGLALTKHFEGLRLSAYQDSVGVLTIGYGHTGSSVHPGMTITEQQATELLLQDVAGAVAAVNRLVTVPVNQDQFDALVDFVYNVGAGNFTRSTLLRELNAGNIAAAAAQFPQWGCAGGVKLPGLLRRRLSEQALFQTSGVPPNPPQYLHR